MSDDWLWDGTGEPDPQTAALARALAPLRYDRKAPRFFRPRRWLAPAGALLLAASALLAVWSQRPAREVASWACGEGCELQEGEWLSTAEAVELEVADIGTMVVSQGSRLRLLATSEEEHRLELARGHLRAQVVAPPRLLVVDTPSASAVDLGCAYDLTVLEDGSSLLIVSSGEVSLEGKARSYVPAGAAAMTWPGHGPGIPWFDDAPVAYAEALAALEQQGQTGKLAEILLTSRPRDTLSLWHLLQRVGEPERARVLMRIVQLVPDAARLDTAAILSLQEEPLDALLELLKDVWYTR